MPNLRARQKEPQRWPPRSAPLPSAVSASLPTPAPMEGACFAAGAGAASFVALRFRPLVLVGFSVVPGRPIPSAVGTAGTSPFTSLAGAGTSPFTRPRAARPDATGVAATGDGAAGASGAKDSVA